MGLRTCIFIASLAVAMSSPLNEQAQARPLPDAHTELPNPDLLVPNIEKDGNKDIEIEVDGVAEEFAMADIEKADDIVIADDDINAVVEDENAIEEEKDVADMELEEMEIEDMEIEDMELEEMEAKEIEIEDENLEKLKTCINSCHTDKAAFEEFWNCAEICQNEMKKEMEISTETNDATRPAWYHAFRKCVEHCFQRIRIFEDFWLCSEVCMDTHGPKRGTASNNEQADFVDSQEDLVNDLPESVKDLPESISRVPDDAVDQAEPQAE